MPHSILMFQFTKNVQSRGWEEFKHQNAAYDRITEMYETHLKKLNPDQEEIEYSITNLYRYIDSLPDLGLFISTPDNTYRACGKKFIKEAVLARIKSMAD